MSIGPTVWDVVLLHASNSFHGGTNALHSTLSVTILSRWSKAKVTATGDFTAEQLAGGTPEGSTKQETTSCIMSSTQLVWRIPVGVDKELTPSLLPEIE